MLIPRFSLRWLLLLTTVCAVFSLIIRFAVQRQHWAVAIVTSVATLVCAMLVYAGLFSLAFLLFQLYRFIRPLSTPTSPFAADTLPPQIIPPRVVDE